jgi:hypothetical protein
LSAQCDSVADILGNIFSQRELRIATKVVNEVAVPEGAFVDITVLALTHYIAGLWEAKL